MKREAAPSSKNNDRGLFRLRAEESHSMTIRTTRITRSRLVCIGQKRERQRGIYSEARAPTPARIYVRCPEQSLSLSRSFVRCTNAQYRREYVTNPERHVMHHASFSLIHQVTPVIFATLFYNRNSNLRIRPMSDRPSCTTYRAFSISLYFIYILNIIWLN
jgi:hypothetical protein